MGLPVLAERLQQAIERDFQCRRCGHCCKGEGLVHFDAAEVQAMADAVGLSRAAFLRRFAITERRGRWILKDKRVEPPFGAAPEIWCVFLERDADGRCGCGLHHAKPTQCRRFPARWRNPDSLRDCLGLRLLMRQLGEGADATGAAVSFAANP